MRVGFTATAWGPTVFGDWLISGIPALRDLIGSAIAGVARWVFGSGVISGVIVIAITTYVYVKSLIELRDRSVGLFNGLKNGVVTGAGTFAAAARRVRTTLSAMPLVSLVLNIARTLAILSIQALWLIASWPLSSLLTRLWNAYIWEAWEMPVGVAWESITGYYTVGCAILLVVAWIISSIERANWDDWGEGVAGFLALGPFLLGIPVFFIMIVGTPILIILSMIIELFGSGDSTWDGLGEIWLAGISIGAFCGITYLAVALSRACVEWWRQRYVDVALAASDR